MPADTRHTAQGALFSNLYRHHHGWLVNWLRRRLENHEQACDLAHDAFLRLWNKLPDEQAREPRAYLRTIAKGLVIDHYRRNDIEYAYQQSICQLPPGEAPSPETRLLVMETLLQIDRLLDSLPRRTREVFLASQLDDMTYPAIAQRFGISLSTVKRDMFQVFRACLELEQP